MIGIGAYSPIEGFFNEKDYVSVVENMRLSSGVVWSLPITLPVDAQKAAELSLGETVKLTYEGETYGVIQIEDLYVPDKQKEAVNVYKTDEQEHPGVKKLFSRGNTYVGGPITLIKKLQNSSLNLHLNRQKRDASLRKRLGNHCRFPNKKPCSQSA